jgi:hypothetical protein
MKRVGVLVVLCLTAIAVAAVLSTAGSARTNGTTIHLVGKQIVGSNPAARLGAAFVSVDALSGDKTGKGYFNATLITKRPDALGQAAFVFSDGQIVAAGYLDVSHSSFDVPVVGGTGKYKNAHGILTSKNLGGGKTDYTIVLD